MELEWRAVQPAAISTASEHWYACGIVGETGEGINGDCLLLPSLDERVNLDHTKNRAIESDRIS